MKHSLFLAAVEATAKTVRTLLTTPQLTRPFREPFTPECMRGDEWLADKEADEEVLAPWWSVEAVKARARVETPLSATFTDEPTAYVDQLCLCYCSGCMNSTHCHRRACCGKPTQSPAVSATDSAVEDPPGGDPPPPGADSLTWAKYIEPAICDVLADHRFIDVMTEDDPKWLRYGCFHAGEDRSHIRVADEQEWRDHVAPLIAKAVRGAL